MAPRARTWALGLALGVGIVAGTSACRGGGSSKLPLTAPASSTGLAGTVTTATGTTGGAASTAGTGTTLPAGSLADALGTADHGDWDHGRFDYGQVTAVHARAAGGAEVVFDRKQLHDDTGKLRSGRDWDHEPIVVGATDVPYVDDSRRLRRYVLAPSAEVLRLADPHPCASDDHPAEPVWKPITVAALLAGAWHDRLEDSVTFDGHGQVARLRLSTDC